MLTTEQKTAAERVNLTFSIVDHVPHELHPSGRYHMGPCPFCGGRDRFQVKQSDAGQLWVCRHCQPTYGDAVSFLMRGGATFCDVLAKYGGYEQGAAVGGYRGMFDKSQGLTAPAHLAEQATAATVTAEPPCDDWQAVAWQAVGRCADNLQREYEQGTAVARYMLGRGITAELAHTFGLGFNPHWMGTAVGKLAPGIVIPCWDDSGLWYVKVRLTRAESERRAKAMGGKLQKYAHLPSGESRAMFNASAVATAERVLIVEGEFDAIVGHAYAPQGTAVVTFGSKSMTLETSPTWGNLLVTRKVYASLDNDESGQGAMAKWLQWPFITAAKPLPAGKDVSELWQLQGGAAVAQWLKQGVTNVEK